MTSCAMIATPRSAYDAAEPSATNSPQPPDEHRREAQSRREDQRESRSGGQLTVHPQVGMRPE